MQTEHKIAIFAIAAALTAVVITVAYNVYDTTIRREAYLKCLSDHKEIQQEYLRSGVDSRNIDYFVCYPR